jgi:hypothetical protein
MMANTAAANDTVGANDCGYLERMERSITGCAEDLCSIGSKGCVYPGEPECTTDQGFGRFTSISMNWRQVERAVLAGEYAATSLIIRYQ